MKRHASIAALLSAALLSSCGKDALQQITGPIAPSGIKFFNFGVGAPGVNFYANETKVTAILSTNCATPPLSTACTTTGVESTTGVAYGAAGAGGFYAGVEPGQYTLTGRIAATTDKNLTIAAVPAAIVNGKRYSFYMSGIYNTATKTADSFLVEDPFVEPTDFTVATVRFVHAISNANPLTLYGKLGTAAEVAVGSEVAYKGAGAFTTIPAGSYDLSARYAGATTNALTRPAVSFSGGRVYTITARGDITVAPSTACAAANRTCLDNTANR
jgi:hypothetical protein